MMVQRKIEDGGLFPPIIARSPTPIEIVTATATRRAVLAMKPTGLPAEGTLKGAHGKLKPTF